MKAFKILFVFVLFSSTLLAQKKPHYLAKRDVVISENSLGSIYITQDKNNELYKKLCPPFDAQKIRSFCVGADTMNLKKFPIEIERYWTDLFLYKDKFYVYAPSDWMNNTPVYIADSILFDVSDNFTFYPILDAKTANNGQTFSLMNAGEKVTLSIIPLKQFPGAAIWQIETEKSTFYKLKVASNAVRNFPMIVNDCLEQKCLSEFTFEEPDFGKLLKTKKN